ncbi:MAG: redoxin domain-containing protein [Planctomycetes bacterium]|nr:redoxin domain-containing protein [Planctomycetota bacterium]
MPHLAEIQKKYKDQVTVLAVSDEDLAKVEAFMVKDSIIEGKTWAQAMSYIVATDPDKSVKTEVFSAAGRRGIPASFIIGKDGKIEWIGHPMRMDEPLAAVLDGTWDRAAARKKYDEDQALQQEMNKIRSGLSAAIRANDQKAAMEILDEAILRFPENSSWKMQKFNLLLTRFHRYKAAYALGQQLLEKNFDDASALNSIAWTIADTEGLKVRDLDLALKAATQANKLTESKEAAILDTLARVYYEKGDLNSAVKWQKLAAKNANADAMGDSIREALERYQKERKARL